MPNSDLPSEKLPIRAQKLDQSRKRSLEFLLLVVGKQLLAENRDGKDNTFFQEGKKVLETLRIDEDGENWTISTSTQTLKVAKNSFKFYQRQKNMDIEVGFPQNQLTARDILRQFLPNLGEETAINANTSGNFKQTIRDPYKNQYAFLIVLQVAFLYFSPSYLGLNLNYLIFTWIIQSIYTLFGSFSKTKNQRTVFYLSLFSSVLGISSAAYFHVLQEQTGHLTENLLIISLVYSGSVFIGSLSSQLQSTKKLMLSLVQSTVGILLSLFFLIQHLNQLVHFSRPLILGTLISAIFFLPIFSWKIIDNLGRNKILNQKLVNYGSPILILIIVASCNIHWNTLLLFTAILLVNFVYNIFKGGRIGYFDLVFTNAAFFAGLIS
jgi:hypothetical protein